MVNSCCYIAPLRSRLGFVFFVLSSHAVAAEPREKIQPEVLDQKIEQVIHERQFSWRLPRQAENGEEAGKSFLVRFIGQILRSLKKWIDVALDWFDEWLNSGQDRLERRQGSTGPLRELLQISVYALAVLGLAAAAYLFWRSRKTKVTAAQSLPITPVIDLTSAEVSPALLEEDGWLVLAREYLEKNEPLLALRAYYLAGLAFLGRKELVRPHQAKSNREYQTELARRSRSTPELMPVFAKNILIFERCWYGGRTVERESLDEFLANLERMRSIAQ
jgi:Domain of unknown function (DUF4129)